MSLLRLLNPNDPIRLRSWFSGRVQGVGFRQMTKTLGSRYKIAGVVRNLADGRVELVCEGSKTELERFVMAIQGSDLGRGICEVQEEWQPAKNEFLGFRIIG